MCVKKNSYAGGGNAHLTHAARLVDLIDPLPQYTSPLWQWRKTKVIWTKSFQDPAFSWLDEHGFCNRKVLFVVTLCDLLLEKPLW